MNVYVEFENRMKAGGMNRKQIGEALGISQSRIRRLVEGAPGSEVDRTLALAMSAVVAGLEPWKPE